MTENVTFAASLSAEDIREALAFQISSTAEWRAGKSFESQHDSRNRIAVEILGRMEASLAGVPDELLRDYERLHDRDGFRASEALSEALRIVGFGSNTESATQLVRSVLEFAQSDVM